MLLDRLAISIPRTEAMGFSKKTAAAGSAAEPVRLTSVSARGCPLVMGLLLGSNVSNRRFRRAELRRPPNPPRRAYTSAARATAAT